MEDCQHLRETIHKYIAGEISPSELESLRRHCEACPDCRQLMEVHDGLLRASEEVPEPRKADLLSVRKNVLSQIAREESSRAHARTRSTFWQDLSALFRAHPAVALPAAAALIVVAVFVGRWSVASRPLDDQSLIQDINLQAARQDNRQAGLNEYWDSPYSYTNVIARSLPGGKLDLSFDVCRHVAVVTAKSSLLATEVLMQAILNPSAMGSKIKAMELAPEILDPKLREALVFAMHNDPVAAVRIEALSILTRYPYDDGVQEALLKTLRKDEAVQMRLLALEYLARRRVNLETLRRTIEESDLESDVAVLQHAVELTKDYQ
jgi:hypothetical protein